MIWFDLNPLIITAVFYVDSPFIWFDLNPLIITAVFYVDSPFIFFTIPEVSWRVYNVNWRPRPSLKDDSMNSYLR